MLNLHNKILLIVTGVEHSRKLFTGLKKMKNYHLQPDPTPNLSLHRGNVYGSQGGGTTANPFLCGVEGNTVVGMCSPA